MSDPGLWMQSVSLSPSLPSHVKGKAMSRGRDASGAFGDSEGYIHISKLVFPRCVVLAELCLHVQRVRWEDGAYMAGSLCGTVGDAQGPAPHAITPLPSHPSYARTPTHTLKSLTRQAGRQNRALTGLGVGEHPQVGSDTGRDPDRLGLPKKRLLPQTSFLLEI